MLLKQALLSRKLSLILWAVTALVLSFLFYSGADRISFDSSDLAHHYSLIKEYMLYGSRTVYKDYLGEMSFYPSGAHRLLANFAVLYSGDILRAVSHWALAMQLLAFISLLLLAVDISPAWRELLYALSCVISIGLLSLIDIGLGNEVNPCFFLPQLAGAAFSLLLLYIILTAFRHRGVRALMLCGTAWAIAWIHLLPAVRLLFIAAAYSFIEIRFERNASEKPFRSRALRRSPEFFLYAVTLIGFVYFHPSYAAMKFISFHEGILDFVLPAGVLFWSAVFITFIIFASYLTLARRRRFQMTKRRKASLALCFGATSLMILQRLLFDVFDIGSMYAVKKSLFGVWTFMTPAFIGLLFDIREEAASRRTDRQAPRALNAWACILLLAAVVQHVAYSPSSDAASCDRFREAQKRLELVDGIEEGGTVFIDAKYAPVMSYMITIGDLHFPRKAISISILNGEYERALQLLNKQFDAAAVLADASDFSVSVESLSNVTVYDLETLLKVREPTGAAQSFGFPPWVDDGTWFVSYGRNSSLSFDGERSCITLTNRVLAETWIARDIGRCRRGWYRIAATAEAANIAGPGMGLCVGFEGKPETFLVWKGCETGFREKTFRLDKEENECLVMGIGGRGRCRGEGLIFDVSISKRDAEPTE